MKKIFVISLVLTFVIFILGFIMMFVVPEEIISREESKIDTPYEREVGYAIPWKGRLKNLIKGFYFNFGLYFIVVATAIMFIEVFLYFKITES